jgi:hypothetical protein
VRVIPHTCPSPTEVRSEVIAEHLAQATPRAVERLVVSSVPALSQHDPADEEQAADGGDSAEAEPSEGQRSVPRAGASARRAWTARGAVGAFERIRERR